MDNCLLSCPNRGDDHHLSVAPSQTRACKCSAQCAPDTPRRNRTPSPQRANLRQVYPTKDYPEEGPGPDIDIIAIHGLDTNSPDTWKWKDPSNRETEHPIESNWLANEDMLPKVAERARIFACDWPAHLLQKSSVPTTLDESAGVLRESINQHGKANTTRPILFIASCLGGIILIKALEMDKLHTKNHTDSPSLVGATRGVVFLATPFRGTAFQNIPGFLLKALASLQDRTVTALIDYTLDATPTLDELTNTFITLQRDHGYHVFMFWGAKKTVLLRKFGLAWMVSTRILLAWLVALTSVWLLDLFSPWLLVFFLLWLPVFSSYRPQLVRIEIYCLAVLLMPTSWSPSIRQPCRILAHSGLIGAMS